MMEKGLIMQSQKDYVYEIINTVHLSHTDFQWGEKESKMTSNLVISILKYDNHNFYFQFDFRQTQHYCIYSPGIDSSVAENYSGSWNNQTQNFKYWLGYLKRDITTPDFWSAVEKSKSLIESSADFESNNPFTKDEVKSISGKLEELEIYLKETNELVGKSAEYLSDRIKYLQESVDRMGRRDWFEILKSVLFDLFSKLLPSDIWQSAFQFASALFNDIFGGSGMLNA